MYEVSNLGRIKSNKLWRRDMTSERILVQCVSKTGYYVVTLVLNGKYRVFKVHRLIAEAFIPNPENKRTVNHKDGDKLNNSLDNLEWATDLENIRHAFKNGLIPKVVGENQSATKLTEKEVKQIFLSGMSRRELAKKYNVGYTTITNILTGESWNHITGLPKKIYKKAA